MKLFDRFQKFFDELYDGIDDERAWGKFFFYLTSLIWMAYFKTFIHELGHAVVAIALGGTITEFVLRLDSGGHIKYIPPLDITPYDYAILNTLVLVSGGLAVMLLFMVLSHKTRWFLIPAVLGLLDGFLEALYMGRLREPLNTLIILTSMWAIFMVICSFVPHSLEPTELEQRNHIPKGALRR